MKDPRTTATASQMKGGSGFKAYLNIPEGIEIFEPEAGKRYEVDLIPYKVSSPDHPLVVAGHMEVGRDWDYVYDFWVHRFIGINNEDLICPESNGQPCPICDAYKKMKADYPNPDKARERELNNLKRKHRVVYYVYDHSTCKYYLFETSYYLFHEELVQVATITKSGEIESLNDPNQVKTIGFLAIEKSLGDGKYVAYKSIDISLSKNRYSEKSISIKGVALDVIVGKSQSYQHIEKIFGGGIVNSAATSQESAPDNTRTAPAQTGSSNNNNTGAATECFGTKNWDSLPECKECPKWDECGHNFE